LEADKLNEVSRDLIHLVSTIEALEEANLFVEVTARRVRRVEG
jgi:hypothetical protein